MGDIIVIVVVVIILAAASYKLYKNKKNNVKCSACKSCVLNDVCNNTQKEDAE